MREFDKALLSLLKTEMTGETKLRTDPDERSSYMRSIEKGSASPSPYRQLHNPVSIGRQPRYVEFPEHRDFMLQVCHMVSGSAKIHINGQDMVLEAGDFFIPNQYTPYSRDALGEDDIMVSFMIKPQFIEEAITKLHGDTILSSFLMDYLKKNIIWNNYLHFSGIEDISVQNTVESMLHVAFPYINEEIIGTGITSESELIKTMMMTLLALLSRNLDTIRTDGPLDYDEVIGAAVESYITNEYSTASLAELSAMVNQSESSLSRQIKRIFGMTFKELLLKRRFERAKVLLSQTNLPIADIAFAVGYENTSYFYRKFKEIYNESPREYRGIKDMDKALA